MGLFQYHCLILVYLPTRYCGPISRYIVTTPSTYVGSATRASKVNREEKRTPSTVILMNLRRWKYRILLSVPGGAPAVSLHDAVFRGERKRGEPVGFRLDILLWRESQSKRKKEKN